ncbi:Protein CBR-SRXA-6 [Caenorhabditis briggsae]|nr:Protein CBR-SRXA-6 [Caenorhabditis briggsae]CAP26030.1 Protein CBR-SRXA-6 [Caenorhabditis briggsae]
MSLFHGIALTVFSILAVLLTIFDVCLFVMAIKHRKDPHFPFAYLTVMSACGVICKAAFTINCGTYLLLSKIDYLEYRQFMGKEITLLGTLNYFIPLCISVVMTMNRIWIVLRPTDQAVFSQRRIFCYSGLILILCLILLLIPYFSTCSVNYLASELIFQTVCWPERHPVTRFTNTHLIWIPTTLLIINVALILHLKAARHHVYSKVFQKMSTTSTPSAQLIQSQKKREQILMRQALALSIYLSFYEVGSFLMRTFPTTYSSLPQSVQDGYFYFRLESICAMNFFVYFVENRTIRKLILAAIGCPGKPKPTGHTGSLENHHQNSVVAPKVSTISMRI